MSGYRELDVSKIVANIQSEQPPVDVVDEIHFASHEDAVKMVALFNEQRNTIKVLHAIIAKLMESMPRQ
jgi:hypothetical protein